MLLTRSFKKNQLLLKAESSFSAPGTYEAPPACCKSCFMLLFFLKWAYGIGDSPFWNHPHTLAMRSLTHSPDTSLANTWPNLQSFCGLPQRNLSPSLRDWACHPDIILIIRSASSPPSSSSDIIIKYSRSVADEKELNQGDAVYICLHSRNRGSIYFPRDGPGITISFSSKASNLKVPLAVDKLHGGGSRMITNGDALQGDKGAILVLRHTLQSCS